MSEIVQFKNKSGLVMPATERLIQDYRLLELTPIYSHEMKATKTEEPELVIEEVNLEQLSTAELRRLCKERSVKGYTKMDATEMVEALKEQ